MDRNNHILGLALGSTPMEKARIELTPEVMEQIKRYRDNFEKNKREGKKIIYEVPFD